MIDTIDKYKVGQIYYQIIETFGREEGNSPWKILASRFIGGTKKKVTIQSVRGGRQVEAKRPWKAHPSPWDAIDEKLSVLDREADEIRAERERMIQASIREIERLEDDKRLLLELRDSLSDSELER